MSNGEEEMNSVKSNCVSHKIEFSFCKGGESVYGCDNCDYEFILKEDSGCGR